MKAETLSELRRPRVAPISDAGIGRLLASEAPTAAHRPRMITFCRFLFGCAVPFAIAGCIVIGITIAQLDRELPDYQQLAHYQPTIMTRMHAGDGRLLAEYAAERRVFVPIEAIP